MLLFIRTKSQEQYFSLKKVRSQTTNTDNIIEKRVSVAYVATVDATLTLKLMEATPNLTLHTLFRWRQDSFFSIISVSCVRGC